MLKDCSARKVTSVPLTRTFENAPVRAPVNVIRVALCVKTAFSGATSCRTSFVEDKSSAPLTTSMSVAPAAPTSIRNVPVAGGSSLPKMMRSWTVTVNVPMPPLISGSPGDSVPLPAGVQLLG